MILPGYKVFEHDQERFQLFSQALLLISHFHYLACKFLPDSSEYQDHPDLNQWPFLAVLRLPDISPSEDKPNPNSHNQ